jgi:hypothetical protein
MLVVFPLDTILNPFCSRQFIAARSIVPGLKKLLQGDELPMTAEPVTLRREPGTSGFLVQEISTKSG